MSQAMCERCNPLGLKEPAPSQAHATVFIGIIAGVVLLAIVAKLMVSNVGPFEGSITGVTSAPAGLRLSLTKGIPHMQAAAIYLVIIAFTAVLLRAGIKGFKKRVLA